MDNFYDLNNFIVYVVKKWKMYIAVILICVIGFAGVRGVSLVKQYKSQPAIQKETTKTQSQEEPMWARVSQVIKIEPVFEIENGQNVDISNRIIQAYAGVCNSQTVMDEMYEKWFEKEKQEDLSRKKVFQSYGYILDKEVNYPYAKYDFESQFLINGASVNGFNAGSLGSGEYNYISIGFKSTNEQQAAEIAKDYAQALTAEVTKKTGDFQYEFVNQTITYELPARSEGTQAGRTAQSTAVFSITKSYIINQCIKGMVWGGILGVFIGIILIFFSYMMTRKLYLVSDLKKMNVNVLGLGFRSNAKLKKLKSKWFAFMEGEKWDLNGFQNLIPYVKEKSSQRESMIAVTGTTKAEYIKLFVEQLNVGTDKFVYVENVTNSAEGIKKISKNVDSVILIEQFGKSLKEEIEKEISILHEKGIEIIGIIGIE